MEDPSTMAGEVYRSPKVWMKIDLPIDQISAQTPADSNVRIKHYIWNQLYRPVHLATVRSKNTFEKDPIVLFHAHRIPKHDYNASIALFLPLTPQWREWWSENSRAFPMIGSATGKEQMLDHGQGWNGFSVEKHSAIDFSGPDDEAYPQSLPLDGKEIGWRSQLPTVLVTSDSYPPMFSPQRKSF